MTAARLLLAVPELAEVEFFRRQWDCGLGKKILAMQLHARKRIFRGTNTRQLMLRLRDARLLRSTTLGKQMLFEFSGGNWLGIHLGMSGTLRVEPAGFRSQKHDHLVLQQAKCALVFRDPRQFGRVRFHSATEPPAWWKNFGPEINSAAFNAGFLDTFFHRHSRAPIKAVLLLQSGFPGIGNRMADEILWRARIAPASIAGRLTERRRGAILRATRFVARGSLRFVAEQNSDPPASWLIHERWKKGGLCPRHRTKLRRETIGGRTTAWCSRCQK